MRIFVVFVAVVGFCLAGCSQTKPAVVDDAGAIDTGAIDEPCSNGSRWPGGTDFSYEHGPRPFPPACTPHCGPNRPASAMWPMSTLTSAALPFGPCAHEGVICSMAAEWVGACADESTAVGPLDVFLCRCQAGAWACTIDDAAPSATVQTCGTPK